MRGNLWVLVVVFVGLGVGFRAATVSAPSVGARTSTGAAAVGTFNAIGPLVGQLGLLAAIGVLFLYAFRVA